MRTTSRLAQNLRFGLRFLHRRPSYSVTAAATLVLTVAAVTTMASLIDQVVLRPLPLPRPNELTAIEIVDSLSGETRRSESIPFATFEAWQQSAPEQVDLAWAVIESSVLTQTNVGVYSAGHLVSYDFLSVIGVEPLMGRWFTREDATRPVVAISYDMWQQDLGGDAAIIGRTISLDRQPYTVVAVMPEGYLRPIEPRVRYWRPVADFGRGGNVLARLPGDATSGDIERMMAPLQRVVQRDGAELLVRAVPLLTRLLGSTRAELWLLMAGVTALFVVALLNLTNLTFASLHQRIQEFSTRSALGATRRDLLAQLFVENIMLCGTAALTSIPVAAWLLEIALSLMPESFPRRAEIGLDPAVWIYAVALSIATGLIVTAMTAARVADPARLRERLQHGSARLAGGLGNTRLRRSLIAVQVGVSLSLLVAVGLLLRSYETLLSQDTGFSADGVVTGHIWRPEGLTDQEAARAFEQVLEEIGRLPDVDLAAAASTIPMGPIATRVDPTIAYSWSGQPALRAGEESRVALRTVTDDYFRVLDVPLLAGRFFDGRERTGNNRTIIVNRALAESLWPEKDPIGREIVLQQRPGDRAHTVVGIVENYRFEGLHAAVKPEVFLSMSQQVFGGASYLAKVPSASAGSTLQSIARAASALDSSMPMIELHLLEDLVLDSVASQQSVLSLLTGFAIFATALAGIGINGLTRYFIGRRHREIAIRMALGAQRSRIRNWVIRDALAPVTGGILIGLGLSIPAAVLLGSFLFGVEAWDPPAYAGALAVVLIVAMLAPLGPAGSAARLEPNRMLKSD